MEKIIQNNHNSERCVETPFIVEKIKQYCKNKTVLDVGGVPTAKVHYVPIMNAIAENNVNYKVCDFRGGDFRGDFVTYNFADNKFDVIIFLSSLEHFPQCTEGDLKFREDEDLKGFQKALSLLNSGGTILMTVPFGKCYWQEYHQNYNMDRINYISKNSSLNEFFVYKLVDNMWEQSEPDLMADVIYTDVAHGVGCFVFEKD